MAERKLHRINDGVEEKHCSRCGWQPIDRFNSSRRRWDGLQPYCRDCQNTTVKQWQQDNRDRYHRRHKQYDRHRRIHQTAGHIYTRVRHSAKKRKIDYCDRTEFITWWNETSDVCEYCGIEVTELRQLWPEIKGAMYRLSVERKDNRQGYVMGNMVKACFVCNLMRNGFLSHAEAKQFLGPMVRAVIDHRRCGAS